MEWEWTFHPWVVILFGIFAGAVYEGARRVTRLFGRVEKLDGKLDVVSDKVDRVEVTVTDLSKDLREHMKDEGESVARLEGMIDGLTRLVKGKGFGT